jgi:copper(I)-binding protein
MRNALTLKTLALVATAWWTPIAWAQPVAVADAWARATVTGQKASGVFMKLTATQATRLVGASSPVAGVVEVHEMKMEKDVMKMAAISGLDLPAGKTVELKPGGYHVMLMDLKAPLQKDSTLALTLMFKDAKGVMTPLDVKVPVQQPTPPAGMHHGGAHKH